MSKPTVKGAFRPAFCPREDLPGQTDLIPILDAMVAEARQKSLPPASKGNGGPALDETPYEILARIGQAMYGDLWHGKLALDIGEDPRTVRRWRAGEGQPSDRTIAWARDAGRRQAARILRAVER